MADQLTEHLGDVVYNPSFRRDAARFLSLPKESVDRLADLVERHGKFDVPPGDVLRFEQICHLEGQGRQVLAAAQLIRQAVRRIGPPDERRQSLIDFAALMRSIRFNLMTSRFFSELPKLEREERRNAAVAVAPTVVESQLYCDLRVISHGAVEDSKLVPVVVARLQFDEPVAGQQALFIQLTEDSLADLKREIDRADVTLRGIRDRLDRKHLLGEPRDNN